MSDKLSLLTISFNCWPFLDRLLTSIFVSQYPWLEIIVIDNASLDGTVEKLRELYPQVSLVQNDRNLGHARAVNQGFRLAKGERILLLDADTEVHPDAIAKMAQFLDEHPEVCLVAPKIVYEDGTLQEGSRNFPTPINALFGRQSLLTRWFPRNAFSRRYLAREHLGQTSPYPVKSIGATCMMLRASLLEEVGFFDEGFHSYWVEADWCKRIEKSGGIIYCVPEAVVVHYEQNRYYRKKNPQRIINFHLGVLRFYCLHYTAGKFDPRGYLAALALSLRAGLLLLVNALKKPNKSWEDPFSRSK